MKSSALTVSIQGYQGSFHHIAAETLLGSNITIQEREHFDQVFSDVVSGAVDYGVVATKNSLYGQIPQVTKLFTQFPTVKIHDQLELPIQQNLIVVPGTPLLSLTEIHSQLPALKQCTLFFADHPQLQQVEAIDTALSVKNMMIDHKKNVGAIASTLAARLYKAEVLIPSIQDSLDNITTFVLFSKRESP